MHGSGVLGDDPVYLVFLDPLGATDGSRSQNPKIHRSDRKTAFWIARMRFSFWGVEMVSGTKCTG
jgi:hypothetical protein